MPTTTIILLGAFAGLTIYLGLPLAFLRTASQSFKQFASMLATGVLVFLFYDIIVKASEPLGEALAKQALTTTFFIDIVLLVLGLVLGSLGLVYFNKYLVARLNAGKSTRVVGVQATIAEPVLVGSGGSGAMPETSTIPRPEKKLELAPAMLALIIAVGIGLHNFSEGLAIGQSAAAGALQLATVLIIGFGLHNMTEGFGIAGPLTGEKISWRFVVLLGLIGGGPTFLGTVAGIVFHSPEIFIFSLALAAGAILYVVVELLGVAKRFKAPEIVMWGLLVGFLLGYATDMIVTLAGV